MRFRDVVGVDPQTRCLTKQVFIPGFLYQVGSSAIVPVTIFAAADLGFSASAALWLIFATTVAATFFSSPAGRFIGQVGDIRSMLAATSAAVACTGLIAAVLFSPRPGLLERFVFGVALMFLASVETVWSIARQGYVAEHAPSHLLGQAMSVYGGSQRIGRLAGPLAGSLVVASAGVGAAFVVHALFGIVATWLVARTAASGRNSREKARTTRRGGAFDKADLPYSWKLTVAIGVGVMAIGLGRTNRDNLVPLWVQHHHSSASAASLLFALMLATELILFLPSGNLTDRWGRMPVAISCCTLMGAGFLLICLDSMFWLLVGCVTMSIGNGLGSGIAKTLGGDLSPLEARAQFLGWWNGFTNIGVVVGQAGAAVSYRWDMLIPFGGTGAIVLLGASLFGSVWLKGGRICPTSGHLLRRFTTRI